MSAQEHKKLALVRSRDPSGQPSGRSRPHVHKLGEACPQQQADITFEGVVPLDHEAFVVQGCHPHMLSHGRGLASPL
jgi:hypothetical protein